MKLKKQNKKKTRVRSKLKKNNINNRFRLSVSRSLKNISAQIIDDNKNSTVVSASSTEKGIKGKSNSKKADLSLAVAETLAKRAAEKKIIKIFFDRGHYKYHGRIKILAETLRKHGLEF